MKKRAEEGVRQLIFIVEASPQSKSDQRYIARLIEHRYQRPGNNVKISWIYLSGKGRVFSKKIMQEAKSKISQNALGENRVFVCLDTDDLSTPEQRGFFEKVVEMCEERDWDFVYFRPDIETVCLGHALEKSEKVKASQGFYRRKKDDIDEECFCCTCMPSRKGSNLYSALDPYFRWPSGE